MKKVLVTGSVNDGHRKEEKKETNAKRIGSIGTIRNNISGFKYVECRVR